MQPHPEGAHPVVGITEQGLDFLLSARTSGVSFDRTITIGRQFLLVPPDRLASMVSGVGPQTDGHDPTEVSQGHDGFADGMFRYLGAAELCSIDASDFEGATYSHDFNTPLPSSLARRFSAVVDAGSLEHIFDFPTAIRNSMQMVEVGGHLLCMSPVNNAAGHGFYQFSPELYFRVLNPDNGFVLERMLLAEVHPRATWYRVVDPARAGRRVEFTTRRQAYLYVQARRLESRPLLAQPPVQSDYDLQWRQRKNAEPAGAEPGPPTAADPDRSTQGALNRLVQTLRTTARRHKAIHVAVRTLRRAAVSYRHRRHPYDPSHFERLGRRLS